MKTFSKAFYFPLLFLSLLLNLTSFANASNIPYASVKIDANSSVDGVTINGAILTIGNQLLCKTTTDFAACQDPGTTGNTQNNYHTQWRTRIDSNVTHSNSMARLVLQSGDTVKFARLYWSARAAGSTAAASVAARDIKIKGPAATTYTQLTSPAAKHGSSGEDYGASADVTQYVINNGEGDYYVGDILSQTNATGIYASWQLVVVVENSARSLKNMTIYDGYDSIYGSSSSPDEITVDADGFITPTGTDPFNANLFVYGGETDDGYGDSTWIKDGSGAWISLVDGAGDANDVMNASVSSPDFVGGYRDGNASLANPNYRNVLGVDIDKLQINDKLDATMQTLSNSQVSTQIRLRSTGDRYSLIMFAFETEVFVPEFCYDYAYTQNGKYFTEDNDGTQPPRLTGDVVEGEPIEMTIFLKSQVDGTIQIQNMEIHVSDINTTQAEYIPNTGDSNLTNATKVAKVGELYPHKVNVNAGTASGMDYIHDIPIGTLDQNEYFYLYYSLDPQQDEMNMPINVQATYNLQLSGLGTPVPYTLTLSEEIPLCSTNNFEYTPAKGIFNVAHNDYYTYDTSSSGTKYYNLPTQVTKREGNFKVLAMDETDFDELRFDHVPTVVAVEMIDAGAFHFTQASCKEMASSISERVWVIIDENTTSASFNQTALQAAIDNNLTKISTTDEFYTKARQNAAFRITYNSSDINGSITSLIKNGTNDYSLAYTLTGQCNQDMDGSGLATDDDVTTYCLANMTTRDLKNCMECIYGIDTRFICSRDNFAIRPEAFMLKLNDQVQHQLIPTDTRVRVADDRSGVDTSTGTLSTAQVELAAGYQYKLEVNATNHVNNTSSLGYTRTFGVGSEDIIEYQWPTSGAPIGCNDEANSTIEFKIVDGKIDLNTSLNQVGAYRLHMHDETWTDVDHNPTFMVHHNGGAPYFILPSTPDCVIGDSTTQVVNTTTIPGSRNGCDINSTHTPSAVANNFEYRDYNVEFHPYWFDINNTITPTVGVNHLAVNATSFIYMADMNISNGQDENMSYHLNGNIVPLGENNATLSNFVDNCYAKPLRIDLNVTDPTSPTAPLINLSAAYKYRFHSLDENGTDLRANITAQDLNTIGTSTLINVLTSDFPKHLNGLALTVFNLNYDRNASVPLNPEAIIFDRYDLNCTNPDTDCTFIADTNGVPVTPDKNATSQGTKDLNSSISIKHYYGRTHAPRNRFVGPDGNVTVYYEVFCNGTINARACNKQLLQPELTTGQNSKVTDDPRWFRNSEHNVSNHGPVIAPVNPPVIPVGVIAQKGGANRVTNTPNAVYNTIPTGPTLIPLRYDATRGYPYKATMLNTPNRWLIYNKYNAAATANESEVEFVSATSNWAGKRETIDTTGEVGSKKTNRRSMW